jgi:hypothetical protein
MTAAMVGRLGIPMGSTELGAGGLSVPPAILTPSLSSPTTITYGPSLLTTGTGIPCTTTGASAAGTGMSTSSGSC